MATTGLARCRCTDPCDFALPKQNTPPASLTSQKPLPPGAAAMPTIGCASFFLTDPRCGASPNENPAPVSLTSHNPAWLGVAAPETIGWAGCATDPNLIPRPKPRTPPFGPASQYPC